MPRRELPRTTAALKRAISAAARWKGAHHPADYPAFEADIQQARNELKSLLKDRKKLEEVRVELDALQRRIDRLSMS